MGQRRSWRAKGEQQRTGVGGIRVAFLAGFLAVEASCGLARSSSGSNRVALTGVRPDRRVAGMLAAAMRATVSVYLLLIGSGGGGGH